MRILVLGKNGMLGRYVYTYLKDCYSIDVIGTTRKDLDAFTMDNHKSMALYIQPGDVVINCVGLIKQRSHVKYISPLEFIKVNSIFPLVVQEACERRQAKFIHITTDCVFDGKLGNYTERSVHNAIGTYGRTKSLGEHYGATIIRTSIIGEELYGKLSLLEWVKSNHDKTINGFTNHYWNGITCLQFAKLCEYMIDNNVFWSGVKHVFSPTMVAKHTLVSMISRAFNLNIQVKLIEAPTPMNMILDTVRTDVIFKIPGLEKQLIELAEYSIK